jgi:hypothetical protein
MIKTAHPRISWRSCNKKITLLSANSEEFSTLSFLLK